MEERKFISEKLNFLLNLLKTEQKQKTNKNFKTRVEKNKEKIIEILKNKKIVTLEDVAKELNISIQRASEYLTELFKEQKVTFFRQKRKKFFRLIE